MDRMEQGRKRKEAVLFVLEEWFNHYPFGGILTGFTEYSPNITQEARAAKGSLPRLFGLFSLFFELLERLS